MLSALIAGLTAAMSLASTFFTNEKTDERLEKQMDWNEKMMDKQNEYNSPSNQMQRLQNAGINPSVSFMGSGTSVSGNTSASPNSSSILPFVDPATTLGNLFNSLSSSDSHIEQAKDLRSTREARIAQILTQNEQLKANADLIGAQAVEQNIINEYADARENYAREEQISHISLTYAQRGNLISGTKKMEYELTNILPEQLQILVREGKLQVLNMDKVIAEIVDLRSSATLKGNQSELAQSQIAVNQQNIQESESRVELTDEQIKYYGDIQEKYLELYDAQIDELSSKADLSKEQTYWYIFDVMSKWKDNTFIGSGLNARRQKQIINSAKKRVGFE